MQTQSGRAFLDGGGFSDYSAIDQAIQRFLQDHGHREMEFDPTTRPEWRRRGWWLKI